jgi:hypothetical protein
MGDRQRDADLATVKLAAFRRSQHGDAHRRLLLEKMRLADWSPSAKDR